MDWPQRTLNRYVTPTLKVRPKGRQRNILGTFAFHSFDSVFFLLSCRKTKGRSSEHVSLADVPPVTELRLNRFASGLAASCVDLPDGFYLSFCAAIKPPPGWRDGREGGTVGLDGIFRWVYFVFKGSLLTPCDCNKWNRNQSCSILQSYKCSA